MNPIKPSYSVAVTDIENTKKLVDKQNWTPITSDSSINERVNDLSARIHMLTRARESLTRDIKDIKGYYDLGFKGFFRQIIDFFTGSPIAKAKTEIKKIDAELAQTSPLRMERLVELEKMIPAKRAELLALHLQRSKYFEEKGMEEPSREQLKYGDLREALSQIPQPVEFFKQKMNLEARDEHIKAQFTEIQAKKRELAALLAEPSAGNIFGDIGAVFSRDIEERNARIQALKQENLEMEEHELISQRDAIKQIIEDLDKQLPEKYRKLPTDDILNLLPTFEDAREVKRDDSEYQLIEVNLARLEKELNIMNNERDELIKEAM